MVRLHKNLHEALNDDALRTLRIMNVNTVMDFLEQDNAKLEKLLKIDRKDVHEIKEQFIETFGGKIEKGRELLRFEEDVVSTGISALDGLLDGGLHPGDVYELCGMSSAGKTQLCLNLAINVIFETNGIVHYIDTKKDFSGSRIQMMLEAKECSNEEIARVMTQIRVTRVINVYELLSVLHSLTRKLAQCENEKSTKLIIIDSLPSLILSTSKNSDNFHHLGNIASVIKFLSNQLHASVITINLVTKWRDIDGFGTAAMEKRPIIKPSLGKFWLQAPNTRLHVEKLTNERRKISVWKSFALKVGSSCYVDLNDAGYA